MKYLTFMIIPYPGADVRSMRISHRALKLLAALFILLLTTAIAFAFYLEPVFDKARQYEGLVLENRELGRQNRKIVELQEKIGAIDEMIGRIQLAQGVRGSDAVPGQKRDLAATVPEQVMEGTYQVVNAGGLQGKPQVLSTVSPRDPSVESGLPYGMPIDEKSFISRMYNPQIYHFGIDFAIKQGTPVRATADGVVSIAEKNENLGYYVMLKHKSGYSTMYAHNSRLTVEKGDQVGKGDLIAYSGNMGVSSGPHLHYAVFDESGNPVDPLPFLQR